MQQRHQILASFLLVVALSLSTGCNVSLPNFRRPGHTYQQQLRATYHDPYGSVSGATEFDGARPDLYQQPRPLPVQSQWYN